MTGHCSPLIQEAIRLFHLAIVERPSHYAPQSLYNMLGEAYVKDGDLKNGRLWYERALAVKPDHVPAHLTMAHLSNMHVRLRELLAIKDSQSVAKNRSDSQHRSYPEVGEGSVL